MYLIFNNLKQEDHSLKVLLMATLYKMQLIKKQSNLSTNILKFNYKTRLKAKADKKKKLNLQYCKCFLRR